MNRTQTLIVADVNVSQDQHGRFSLNDLHRAAGGRAIHKPAQWLRTDQTKSLIAELGNGADLHRLDPETQSLEPVSTVEGRSGSTFVVRELVYAYAMWISATFHLKVIRAYDAMVTLGAAAIGAVKPTNMLPAIKQRTHLVLLLAKADSAAIARNYFRCLQMLDAELGWQTEPIADLAPVLRQGSLAGV